MVHNYTLDEIRVVVRGEGSMKSKIEKLVKDGGLSEEVALATYKLIIKTEGLKPRPRKARQALRKLLFTMGVEIECSNVNVYEVRTRLEGMAIKTKDDRCHYNHDDSNDTYKFMSDASVHGDSPCEIVSPVLTNLDSLNEVCKLLNDTGAEANSTCGLHVHIGADSLTDEDWYRIVCNYGRIESAIDSFMPPSRRGDCRWAKSVKGIEAMVGTNHTRSACSLAMNRNRYYKVNLQAYNVHKTIEFRQHSGTTNFVKMQNWIDFLTKLITYSINNDELIPATSRIEDIPFVDGELKTYLIERRATVRG